jgi:multisubunit Na+/H+ antiporter MnhF subunit
MAASQNPLAPEHLPFFITAPGQTDVLLHIAAWFVLLCVIGLGVIFLTIHSLPERVAHRTKKIQLDIVAVLCLLALLTNEHIFWFAALLLAFIDLPDFLTPVMRIASAVETMAGTETPEAEGTANEAGAESVTAANAEAGRASGEAALKKVERAEPSPPKKKGTAHA